MEDLYRAIRPGLQIIERDDTAPVMAGRFTVYNQWTEIDSGFEGHFMERISPGALKKTIQENISRIRVLFSHGKDPSVGIKPLGTIDVLREEDDGPHFEVSLLDAQYVRDLMPGLKAGVYGMSFHASVVKMDETPRPQASEFNRYAIPERTYTELRLREFGPTPFPAVDGTDIVMRSETDQMILASIPPEVLREALAGAAALPDLEPEASTPDPDEPQHSEKLSTGEEDKPPWLLY